MSTADNSTPAPRVKGAARVQTIEEQRAALYKELAALPDSMPDQQAQAKQALVRLSSPQHIKQAALSGIFVNYARPDELFAIQLAEDLSNAGLLVWLDIIDIPDGADWHAEVQAALKHCGLMVMVMSSQALDDSQRAEAQQFMESGKIIIPVIYQRVSGATRNLPIQPIDFRHDYTLGRNILTRLLTSQPATPTRF